MTTSPSPSKPTRRAEVEALATTVATVPLKPIADKATAEAVHGQLVGLVATMGRDFLAFLGLVERVLGERTYVAMGYSDVSNYFEAVGVPWKTVRRHMPIMEGLQRVPEPDRDAVRGQLGTAGVHKSIVLAPILGLPDHPWKRLVERAPKLAEADLQMEVSRLLGARRRGRAARAALAGGSHDDADGERNGTSRWLRGTLALIREEGTKAEITNCFSAGRAVLGTDSDLAVLIAMVQEVKVELETEARDKHGWEPMVEESGERVNQGAEGA